MARSCIQSLLKYLNYVIGMVALATIFYALLMFSAWHIDTHADRHPLPWFIYAVFALGASLCLITFFGHIAAKTANGCCLYSYTPFIFLILMLEIAVSLEVFINFNWEEDFPDNPTGNIVDLKYFIKKNYLMCKWIGFSIVTIQGLCMLFAMILKTLGPNFEESCESDDDYTPEGVPLLINYVPQTPSVVGAPVPGCRNDSYSIRFIKDMCKGMAIRQTKYQLTKGR